MALLDPNSALNQIPPKLREELLHSYIQIVRNFSEHRWEPSELNGGKFSEVVYSVLDGYLSGTFPTSATKPPRFADACRSLEQRPATALVGDRSARVLIPRVLIAVYEIRNNRGVGHVGGDVDPNNMDSLFVLQSATWVLAELVRLFHAVSPQQAQEVVELLVNRPHPQVWSFGDVRRVLNPALTKGDQSLILMYSAAGWVAVNDLVRWVEHSNGHVFRNKVLQPLHDSRIIEFDRVRDCAMLTPKGSHDVEQRLIESQ